MRVFVNNLSFQYKLYSQEDALDRVMNFIQICHEIESGKLKNVDELIVAENIDVQFEIAPGCKIIKLLQRVLPKEEMRYLLSIFMNRGFGGELPEYPFEYDERESYACAAAKDEAVVSLLSTELFSDSIIAGKINKKDIVIKNIGTRNHIFEYRQILGKRIYRPNNEKHKKHSWNSYGKGKVASPMDLDDELAQSLLDRAIEYKGKLYGRFGGNNYSFQNEQDVYYHGYIDKGLGDDVKSELDKYEWI